MKLVKKAHTRITIPAYTHLQKGIQIDLTIQASTGTDASRPCSLTGKLYLSPDTLLSVNAFGNVAGSLQRIFTRTIQIMSSLKKEWEYLSSLNFTLHGDYPGFIVKDARSASIAFAIALINIDRVFHQQAQHVNMVGTGILRVDGSIEESHFEAIKRVSCEAKTTHSLPDSDLDNQAPIIQFITSGNCQHLFELQDVMAGK